MLGAPLRRPHLLTHRPVGHLIAKGALLEAITAEIWGKATGCVGGKGGQMHLADFAVGAMVSNAIVGANIPIATGSAMSFRLQRPRSRRRQLLRRWRLEHWCVSRGAEPRRRAGRAGSICLRKQSVRRIDQFRLDGAYYSHCCPCGRLRYA